MGKYFTLSHSKMRNMNWSIWDTGGALHHNKAQKMTMEEDKRFCVTF